MIDQNNLKNLAQKANKATSFYDKIWILLGVFGLAWGIFAIATGTVDSSDFEPKTPIPTPALLSSSCPQTNLYQVQEVDKTPLNTITQIATVDYSSEVFSSRLGKNALEPITNPKFEIAKKLENCFREDEEFIVIQKEETTKAYPKSILVWHQAVNDTIENEPVLITFCPLCDYFAAYSRSVSDEELLFGTSGLYYKNSNLVFDVLTDSLWSPYSGDAIVGEFTGAKLEQLDFELIDFKTLLENYPDAKIMSHDTGFVKNYSFQLEPETNLESKLITPRIHKNTIISESSTVVGFFIDDQAFAISTNKISSEDGYELQRSDGILKIKPYGSFYQVSLEDGDDVEVIQSYRSLWFAWLDHSPNTFTL